jgi:hypothetical protein
MKMNRLKLNLNATRKSELEQVVEPLVSYICATDKPQAVLVRALALLVNEVEQINRVAGARVAAFAGGLCS